MPYLWNSLALLSILFIEGSKAATLSSIANLAGFKAIHHPELSITSYHMPSITNSWQVVTSNASGLPSADLQLLTFKNGSKLTADGAIWTREAIPAYITNWRVQIRFRDICAANKACGGFAVYLAHRSSVNLTDKSFGRYGIKSPFIGFLLRVIPNQGIYGGARNGSSIGDWNVKSTPALGLSCDLIDGSDLIDALMIIQSLGDRIAVYVVPRNDPAMTRICFDTNGGNSMAAFIHYGNMIVGLASVSMPGVTTETVQISSFNFYEWSRDLFYVEPKVNTLVTPTFGPPAGQIAQFLPDYSFWSNESISETYAKWYHVGRTSVIDGNDFKIATSEGQNDFGAIWGKFNILSLVNSSQIEVGFSIDSRSSGDGFSLVILYPLDLQYTKVVRSQFAAALKFRFGFSVRVSPKLKKMYAFYFPNLNKTTPVYYSNVTTTDLEMVSPFLVGQASINTALLQNATLVVRFQNDNAWICLLSSAAGNQNVCLANFTAKCSEFFDSLSLSAMNIGIAASSSGQFDGLVVNRVLAFRFGLTVNCGERPQYGSLSSQGIFMRNANDRRYLTDKSIIFCPANSVAIVNGTLSKKSPHYYSEKCGSLSNTTAYLKGVTCEASALMAPSDCGGYTCYNGGTCADDASLPSAWNDSTFVCKCKGTFQPPDCWFDSALLPQGALVFYPMSRYGFIASSVNSLLETKRRLALDWSGSGFDNVLGLIDDTVGISSVGPIYPFNCSSCQHSFLFYHSRSQMALMPMKNWNFSNETVFSLVAYVYVVSFEMYPRTLFFSWVDEYDAFLAVALKIDTVEILVNDPRLDFYGVNSTQCTLKISQKTWNLFQFTFDKLTSNVSVILHPSMLSCTFKLGFPRGSSQSIRLGYNSPVVSKTFIQSYLAVKCFSLYKRRLSTDELDKYSNACIQAHIRVKNSTSSSTSSSNDLEMSELDDSSSSSDEDEDEGSSIVQMSPVTMETETKSTEQPQNSDIMDQTSMSMEASTLGTPKLRIVDGKVYLPEIPQISQAVSQAIPSVDSNEIVSNCEDVSPFRRSPPPLKEGGVFGIKVTLGVDRVLGINDLEQSMSIAGTLFVQWAVSSCSSERVAPNLASAAERIVVQDVESVWRPSIELVSAVDDITISSSMYDHRFEIMITNSYPNRVMYFYWKRRGIFRTTCHLDLAAFPFDAQTCSFVFSLEEASHLIRFAEVSLNPPSVGWSSIEDSGWRFVTSNLTRGLVAATGGNADIVSRATYSFKFQRNPKFFIDNLVAPWLVLTAIQLASFLMPPESSDRFCFGVYVFLAMSLNLAQFLQYTPKTPQHILLGDYFKMLSIISALTTSFAIFQYRFVNLSGDKTANKVVTPLCSCLSMRLCRFVDCVIFLLTCILLVIINLYTFAPSVLSL